METDKQTPPKPKRDTRFRVGVGGNPKGRKKGSKNAMTLMREALATPDLLKFALATTVQAARNGDVAACKLILDRVWPLPRSTLPVGDPIQATGDSLIERGEAVISAALRAELPPDVASLLLQGLQAQARLVESEMLTERVARLEALLGGADPE